MLRDFISINFSDEAERKLQRVYAQTEEYIVSIQKINYELQKVCNEINNQRSLLNYLFFVLLNYFLLKAQHIEAQLKSDNEKLQEAIAELMREAAEKTKKEVIAHSN